MKRRIGFVSNSSSSSFVLYLKKPVEYSIDTIDDLDRYFISEYYDNAEDFRAEIAGDMLPTYLYEKYHKLADHLNRGEFIYFKEVESGAEEDVEEILKLLGIDYDILG